MKTKTFFLAILAAFVMAGSAKAQLQINSDGGVRIGTTPADGWTLSSNGFEINYDDILLHTKMNSTQTISDRRAKENIQTIIGAKDVVYKEPLKKGDLSGQIEIPAGKLAPGLYTYSLVANGRTLDSKKMMVTE